MTANITIDPHSPADKSPADEISHRCLCLTNAVRQGQPTRRKKWKRKRERAMRLRTCGLFDVLCDGGKRVLDADLFWQNFCTLFVGSRERREAKWRRCRGCRWSRSHSRRARKRLLLDPNSSKWVTSLGPHELQCPLLLFSNLSRLQKLSRFVAQCGQVFVLFFVLKSLLET